MIYKFLNHREILPKAPPILRKANRIMFGFLWFCSCSACSSSFCRSIFSRATLKIIQMFNLVIYYNSLAMYALARYKMISDGVTQLLHLPSFNEFSQKLLHFEEHYMCISKYIVCSSYSSFRNKAHLKHRLHRGVSRMNWHVLDRMREKQEESCKCTAFDWLLCGIPHHCMSLSTSQNYSLAQTTLSVNCDSESIFLWFKNISLILLIIIYCL